MKLCAACHIDLPKDSYSKKQWKLDENQRRCKVCITNNREVQPQPPHHQNNNDTNTNEIIKALDSMYLKDFDKKISDEELFKQPQPTEDCPICFLRMPTLETGYRYMTCCGKIICSGCIRAMDEIDEDEKCPFCRVPAHETFDEELERMKKRVDAGDTIAIHFLGCWYSEGEKGLPLYYTKALELWHRAAHLGYAEAYCNIGYSYANGIRGVVLDKKKAQYYYKLAAMAGDTQARHNLGNNELRAGNMDRALKHYLIAGGCGHANSLGTIKELYSRESITKEDYTKALRSYQAYLSEIKSAQRDEAAAFSKEMYRYY